MPAPQQGSRGASISSPAVSIVSPFYNAKRWLPGLVACSSAQTFGDFEHLLVDDVSTDGSRQLGLSLTQHDARYRVLSLPKNSGPAAARQAAIAQARGRFIAFLDADDLWLPEKLARQTQWMLRHGHAFSFHDYRFISEDGQRVGERVQPPDVLDARTLHTRRGVGCLTVMIDRQLVPDFSFPVVSRALPEDHFAWLTVLGKGHLGYRMPEDLARYRVFQGSRSGNKFRAAKLMWQMYRNVEKLSLWRTTWWWSQYAWNAYWLHKRSQPR